MKIVASDLMSRSVTSVSTEMPLGELAELLAAEEIHGAPVVGRDGGLAGVVSRTDVIRALSEEQEAESSLGSAGIWDTALSHLRNAPTNDQRVRDVMTPHAIVASPDTSAGTLAKQMLDEQVQRILIVKDNDVVGLVSSTDLLEAVIQYENAPVAKLAGA